MGHQHGSFPFSYIYSVQHFLTSELRSFTDCKMLKCLDDFIYHSMWHLVTNSTTSIWEEKGEKQSASWKADGGFFLGQRWRIAQDGSSLNRHRAQSTEPEWCRCVCRLWSLLEMDLSCPDNIFLSRQFLFCLILKEGNFRRNFTPGDTCSMVSWKW